uniref:insulinase family protein n=1 Tax=uncultured Draconibacterium sp. TaxID=1573823 RepID=UPI0032172C37
MYRLLVSYILLMLCFSSYSEELQQTPKLIKGQLENGLTYYIYPNDYPKGEAVYRLFIKSGSVFETEEQRGLAHFIEHMAFNGSLSKKPFLGLLFLLDSGCLGSDF